MVYQDSLLKHYVENDDDDDDDDDNDDVVDDDDDDDDDVFFMIMINNNHTNMYIQSITQQVALQVGHYLLFDVYNTRDQALSTSG